ncbi:hypothetical protein [Cryobacterium sp. TMT2-4]|uniref:hypothetical protein n=1 Tax=Cryobacterium sp. TMT2-4 TaxID=1259254 RepID=UPI00106CED58|nr:hypothetical protein [Cryobacterium sp. TMT2-4]TFC71604.1 hypothetical protein E3O54_00270 [Cryobacterium sp. TMT2-4]
MMLTFLSIVPRDAWWRTTIASAAGVCIGLGLNLLLLAWAEHRKKNSAAASREGTSEPWQGWAIWAITALVFFVAYLLLLVFAPRGDFFMGLTVTCLAFGVPSLATALNRYFPGKYTPGWFLFPFFCDAMMLTAFANIPAAEGVITGIALLFPGLVVAFVVAIWAYKIRNTDKHEYVKGTETARGILGAWTLIWLLTGFYSMTGQPISTTDPYSPLTVLLALVTIGSVVAAITSGYTQYVEASQGLPLDQAATVTSST